MRPKHIVRFTGILVLAVLFTKGTLSLRNVRMIIPEAVERGKTAVIKCVYDLENEDLYQVKWYRGAREFCRYAPKDVPPLKIFPIHGIEVDREQTDWEKVTIKATSYNANGRYACEVSADAPSFVTAHLEGMMYVVDLPKVYPKLRGIKGFYKPGMKLKGQCIVSNSMPAANITFYVNDKPAHEKHLWRRVSGGTNGSLWTAYSTLQFVLQDHHFIEGKITIKCRAVIYSIFDKSLQITSDLINYVYKTTIPPDPVTNPKIFYDVDDYYEYRLPEPSSDAWNSAENACSELFIATFVAILLAYVLLK